VVVKSEDIDLIVNELEVDKARAELALRENKGDVVAALRHLISV
jgi:NACalpha-BTF3-like transcription factor